MSPNHESSKDFLAKAFLVCPECGDDGQIDKINKDHFIVVCKCTKWKISFKISEV